MSIIAFTALMKMEIPKPQILYVRASSAFGESANLGRKILENTVVEFRQTHIRRDCILEIKENGQNQAS
ncbi:MAG: hypothetical protein ACXACG_11690 [Candidatus Thorarchaeota archaeon]|jgi:hypothetical protein